MSASDDPAVAHNPASHPTRVYSTDRETHLELVLLLKHRTAQQHALLHALTTGELVPTEPQREAARWLNKWAEASGFVPLVEQHDGRFRLADGAREPVLAVLADPQAQPPARPPAGYTVDPTGQGPDPRRHRDGKHRRT